MSIDWSRMPWPFTGFKMPEITPAVRIRDAEHHVHEPVGDIKIRGFGAKYFVVDDGEQARLYYVGAEER